MLSSKIKEKKERKNKNNKCHQSTYQKANVFKGIKVNYLLSSFQCGYPSASGVLNQERNAFKACCFTMMLLNPKDPLLWAEDKEEREYFQVIKSGAVWNNNSFINSILRKCFSSFYTLPVGRWKFQVVTIMCYFHFSDQLLFESFQVSMHN